MRTNKDIYIAIGMVVKASQLFEAAFVISANLALKQADITSFEELVPVSKDRAFKQPIKAILQELSKVGHVEDTLDNRVSQLIERRHKIIHREFLSSGWPGEADQDWARSFETQCTDVVKEYTALTIIFIRLLTQWLEKFDETKELSRKYEPMLHKLQCGIKPKR